MVKKTYLLWCFISLFYTTSIFACSPIRWSPELYEMLQSRLLLSNNSQYLLQMVPSKWSFHDRRQPKKDKESSAIVYKATSDGKLLKLWSIKNLYPIEFHLSMGNNEGYIERYSFFLTNDGKTIFKLSTTVKSESSKDLIIYREGKIVAKYSYSDFTAKTKKQPCSAHRWLGADNSSDIAQVTSKGELQFTTFDGRKWTINPNGKIVKNQ